MANKFTKTKGYREGGPESKDYLVYDGSLVIDTPANEFLAAVFDMLRLHALESIITKDDDAQQFNGVVSFDRTKLIILDKDTGAQTNLTNGTWRVLIKGQN